MNVRFAGAATTHAPGAIALAVLLSFALAAGCSLLGDSVEVGIVLPELPPEWEPILRAEGSPSFLVRAPGRGRLPQELLVPVPGAAPSQAACRLTLPKRANLPVVAVPIVQGRSDLLRPAGGLFPAALGGGGTMALAWKDGFLATLLLALAERGQLIEALNARRLSGEIEKRCAGDPWSLDREAILLLLSLGSFRTDRIKELPPHSLVLHCAPGSRWVEGNPFRPAIQADELGVLAVAPIVAGFHAFFRVDGSPPAGDGLERLDVSVTDEEWLAGDSLTGAVESGRW